MPFVEGKLLACFCPLVNLDLFKKGHYHISCRVSESPANVDVHPDGIKDYFGGGRSGLSEYCFPGACMLNDRFLTQTVFIEFTSQSFIFCEYFMFKISFPITTDYNDIYVPCQISLTLDLMYSGAEDLPGEPGKFEKVSTRTVSLNIDWRKGLHDHTPVLFDYAHMAAMGVTVHASLYNISQNMYIPPSNVLAEKKLQTNSKWSFQHPSSHIGYRELLFGEQLPGNRSKGGENTYLIPNKLIERARHAHKMVTDVLINARDNLRTGFIQMTGDVRSGPAISAELLEDVTTIEEIEMECRVHLEALGTQLQAMWEWFCHSVVVHPGMMSHLATQSHSKRLEIHHKAFIDPSNELVTPTLDYTTLNTIETLATAARNKLLSRPLMYSVENSDNSTSASVILVEQCPWEVRFPVALDPASVKRFQTQLSPYLINSFPSRPRMQRSRAVHLVICVHGLQGNQFDLRLYKSYLELSLPYHKLDFLMSQANQFDTFVKFTIQTDRLEREVLDKINSMTAPPNRISFLAHSLGGVVVRSLITRRSMMDHVHKLHLLLSICGPHLGTQHQTGVISAGMWLVRKWYNSDSLLQLSLKDTPNPRDSFLYHLSEAHTFDCFKHVVLLTSLQDKYVPHKSARVYPGNEDGTVIGKVCEEMAANIMYLMEQAGVNLVRATVHHALTVTADSLIGRAAHVAMLDNEQFVEKFVLCHLAQYFLDT